MGKLRKLHQPCLRNAPNGYDCQGAKFREASEPFQDIKAAPPRLRNITTRERTLSFSSFCFFSLFPPFVFHFSEQSILLSTQPGQVRTLAGQKVKSLRVSFIKINIFSYWRQFLLQFLHSWCDIVRHLENTLATLVHVLHKSYTNPTFELSTSIQPICPNII